MTVSKLIDILKTFKQDNEVYYADSEYVGFALDVVKVIELKEPLSYYSNNGNEVINVTEGVVIY